MQNLSQRCKLFGTARRHVLRRAIEATVRSTATWESLEARQLLSASSLDTSFSGDGKLTTNLGSTDVAAAVLILSGSKVLSAGRSGINAAITQYTSAGILDTSFGGGDGIVTTRFSSGSTTTDAFDALAPLSGGKFLAAGVGSGGFALARYTSTGALDTTFGTASSGKVTTNFTGYSSASAAAIAVQPDGKIILAGFATKTSGHDNDIALVRYNANGSLDTTFGVNKNGKVTFDYQGFNDAATGVALFSNGKIAVGATLTNKTTSNTAGDSDIGVIRFNSNGTLDTTFSPGGTDGNGVATADFSVTGAKTRENDYAGAIMVSCGSRFIVAGTADRGTSTASQFDFALVKFMYNGSLDTSFGSAHTGKVTTDLGSAGDEAFALKMTPMNKILVAGESITGTTKPSYDFAAAQYNADGTPDTTFNPGATTTVGKQTLTTNFNTTSGTGSADAAYALAVEADGKFVLAGTSDSDFALARYSGVVPTGDGNNHLCGAATVAPSKSGTSISGSISTSTDVDLYAINVTAGQTIGFNINLASGSSLDSYLRLFDFQGNQIAFNDNGAAPGETLGKSSYLKYTFTTAGTYYVGISGAPNTKYDPITEDGAVAGSTGGYSLIFTDLTSTSSDSAGNTISTAKTVSIGSTTAESIGSSTDVDVYAVTVIAGETIGFNINQTSGSTLDSYLRLFNSSGTQIAFNNDGAASGETLGKSSYLSYTFTTGGIYYVGISGYSNISYSITTGSGAVAGSVGGYDLIISNLTSDSAGSSISTAKSVTIGSTTSETIGTSTDIDVYKITVTAGETISFNLNDSGSFDSYLRIFNSSGTQITFNDNGAAPGETLGTSSYISYTFTSGGTYYVGVSGHGNSTYNVVTGGGTTSGSTGLYSLIITYTTPTGDPDDQISEAHFLSAGEIATDSISNSTDVDMYYVNVPAGATFNFDIDQTSGSSLDSYLRLFNSSGTQLTANDNGAAPGETLGVSSYISYTFATAGDYYIGVSGAPNKSYSAVTGNGDVAGSTGGYSLTVSVPSGTDPDDTISTARTLAMNSTISDSISTSEDVDAYKFTATAGTVVGISIDVPAGSNLTSFLELVASNGGYITSNSGGTSPAENYNGKNSYIEYLIPTTGTYYAFVSGSPNTNFDPITGGGKAPGSSGAYSITLTNISTQDPDDTIDAAHPIAVGGTAADTISNPNDVDVYQFTVKANQTIGFDLTAASTLTSFIELANSSGYYITSNSGSPAPDKNYNGRDSYLEYTFPTAGTYYLAVSTSANTNFSLITGGGDHAGVSTSEGGYSLHLTDIGAEDPDDQLSEAHAVSTNTTINDSISNANDVDVYKFTVSAGEQASFNINVAGSSNLASFIEIANSSGYYITSNSGSPAPGENYNGKDSYLDYTFTTSGTYYLAVSNSSNTNFNLITGGGDHGGPDGTTGSYTLIIKTL
jgi:uncharacterized delta-60 repeat protein